MDKASQDIFILPPYKLSKAALLGRLFSYQILLSGYVAGVKMQIENVDIKDINPYEGNPRKNEGAIDYVANSIKEF